MSEVLKPYRVGIDKGIVRYYSRGEAQKIRDIEKTTVQLTIDPNNPIIKVVELPRGEGNRNCEFCEDNPGSMGIFKATRLLILQNGERMLSCTTHNPLEKVPQVYGRDY